MARDVEIVEHIPHLRRYALALLRDRDAADDLVQDCLERALSRWRLFRGGGSPRAWLFTIMHNIHVNAVKRRAVGAAAVDGTANGVNVAPTQDHRLEVLSVARALERLPPEQREIVLMIGLEQLSYAEAATAVGVPIGTVMSRLHRGRERLRSLMADGSEPRLTRVK